MMMMMMMMGGGGPVAVPGAPMGSIPRGWGFFFSCRMGAAVGILVVQILGPRGPPMVQEERERERERTREEE